MTALRWIQLCIVLKLTMFVAGCSASVIYDNGASNRQDGANIVDYTVADDFTLLSTTIIDQVSLAVSADVDPFPNFSNFVRISFLTDNSGSPGRPVFDGYISPAFVDTGRQSVDTEEYQLNLSIPSDPRYPLVVLTPGSYWIAINLGTIGNLSQTLYWDTTSSVLGLPALASPGARYWPLNQPWNNALSGTYGTEVSFQLSGEQLSQSPAPEGGTFSICLFLALLSGCWRKVAENRNFIFCAKARTKIRRGNSVKYQYKLATRMLSLAPVWMLDVQNPVEVKNFAETVRGGLASNRTVVIS